MGIRKLMVRAVPLAMAMVMIASPAFAHQCYKTGWNEVAAEKMGGKAWFTADMWLGMLAEVPGDAPDACLEAVDAAVAEITALPDDTLFMGPGALAGISRHAGGRDDARGPSQMGYLKTIHGVFMNCPPPPGV